MLFDDVVEGGVNISGQYYLNQLGRLYAPLTSQVLDLRSVSAKEAGRTIQIMAQCLQNDFEQIAYKFIQKGESLIKLIHNGTKMLAEVGNQTIIHIITNVYAPK